MTKRRPITLATLTAAVALAGAATNSAEASSGLSTAQASKLQRQMDHVLETSKPGGRQVAPNKIEWLADGVTLTLPTPGRVGAAGLANCPSGRACLWRDANYSGWQATFYYYRTYNLAYYGLPPFRHEGASSYYNHQTGGARAILHADFDFSMRGYGNLYGSLNDRGRSITLAP